MRTRSSLGLGALIVPLAACSTAPKVEVEYVEGEVKRSLR
jgi:hypothetical protein